MTPLPTNDTDFVNHTFVSCLKSGKWVAKIQHPIRKVCVCVGIYNTPKEAADACTRKKLEYESRSEQEKAASFPTDVTNIDKHVGIRRVKSGKWEARIKHNNVRLQLGSYDTANEAADAYTLSKLELDSQKLVCSGKAGALYSTESGTLKAADKRPVKADVEQSVKLHRPRHAYRARAGRWRTEIRHPIIKGKKINLGGFDTAEEAANAYDSLRHDLDLMFPGHKKMKQSNNSCKAEAFAEGDSDSTCVSGDPQAEEAYNNKMHEVSLIVRAHRKRTQNKGSCEAAAVVEGTSHSTWISGDPSVSTRVHLGACTEEAYNNAMHEFDLMERKQSKDADAQESISQMDAQAIKGCRCTRMQVEDAQESISQKKLGKWEARIKHNKVRLQLGSYDTANESADAYNLSKLELDSQKLVCSGKAGAVYSTESGTPKAADNRPVKAVVEQSVQLHIPLHAYRARAGRWRTGIRHPIIKGKTITLGGFHTAEEAANAYDSIRHDLDFMFPGHKKIKQSNNSCKAEAFAEGNSDSTCVSGDPQAEEAFNNKIHEVDLIVRAHRKRKQYKGSCEAAAVVESKSYSTCVSDDPSASSDGSLVIKTGRGGETRRSVLNENVQSVPMFVTEERGEFDSDVIDSYGQLVGEYSRLDDELWLCRSEDDATLEHDDGHECF